MGPTARSKLELARQAAAEGRVNQARSILLRLAGDWPRDAEVHAGLRDALIRSEKWIEASKVASRVLQLRDPSSQDWSLFALTSYRIGDLDGAERAYRRALDLDPENESAVLEIMGVLTAKAHVSEVLTFARRGMRLNSERPEYHLAAADMLNRLGKSDEAGEILRNALFCFPCDRRIAEMHCFVANNSMEVDRQVILEAHRNCGRLIAQLSSLTPSQPVATGTKHKRLRVALVSPDLRRHSVWHFIAPWLEHADRDQFHITGVPTMPSRDSYTDYLRARCDDWRLMPVGSHAEVISQLRAMEFDVVIELAGLTRNHVLDVLHLRAAPIQITYIGYPNTTGVANLDFRIVDTTTDPPYPPFNADLYATETLIRLDPCFLCYHPPMGQDLPSPARTAKPADGPVVFGSYSASWKINDSVLSAWSRVVNAVEGSRLRIKSAQLAGEEDRAILRERCVAAGMLREAVTVVAPLGPIDHLRSYDEIDIALDTFPYQGTTTTCEAMLMGVPVVSVAGLTHASRVGASLLNAAGTPELLAESVDEYVRIAVGLAMDPARRFRYHRTLRDKLLESPVCDGRSFSRRLELALRSLWIRRCDGRTESS